MTFTPTFTSALIEELEILSHYNLSTTLAGVKVHKTADAAVIAATERLYKKALITQIDGGYLTPLGLEAATHAQNMLTIMTSA
jgi:uncharacterized protein (TIGR02647 family)